MSDIIISRPLLTYLHETVPGIAPLVPIQRYDDSVMRTAAMDDALLTTVVDAIAAYPDIQKEDRAVEKTLRATLSVRAGDDGGVLQRLDAVPTLLVAWVNNVCAEGWVMVSGHPGEREAVRLIWDAKYHPGDRERPAMVSISLAHNAPGRGTGEDSTRKASAEVHTRITVNAEDLLGLAPSGDKRTRRTLPQLLEHLGMRPATAEDVAAHDREEAAFQELLATGFASQHCHTGVAQKGYSTRRNVGAKVVHDVAPGEQQEASPLRAVWGSDRYPQDVVASRRIPTEPLLRVFDLARQEFDVVDTRDLTPYVYDKSLREKLVLPQTHRELLDVLTTDLDDYTDDIVEGKSAGNVILAQGRPGVGKTLTAEVYAELIERPLYAIHSGSLGVSADSVRKNLETIFRRAARWDAVLLLDEADVFVIKRGNSLEQNAIVAEFLRTLEYFKGLMFATTNRSDEIDDAILSRCAAIINYTTPAAEDARRVWEVLVANAGATEVVSGELIEHMVSTYPGLAPRDVKMVLRLALRIAASRGVTPSAEIFERCILFRGLTAAAG